MNRNILWLLIFILSFTALLFTCSSKKDSGNDNVDGSSNGGGSLVRPSNTTCLAGARSLIGSGLVDTQRAFSNLSFNQPLGMYQEPLSSQYWYVIEKPGMIYRFINDSATASVEVFADLTASVDDRNEGGLLGMAFHPDFVNNGLVFLSYTLDNAGFKSRISRFDTNNDRSAIVPNSEIVLIEIQQPYLNHDGGNIAFGPDGYLYIGFGDGGDGGDPQSNGQDTTTLLGAMLRIDVNVSADELNSGIYYKSHVNNPFYVADLKCTDVNSFDCPEIYAWGFRNPWRWSFDQENGSLWVGDVGQNVWEEIDLVVEGGNYGWRCYEGNHDYNTNGCTARDDYAFPVVEYEHPIIGVDRANRSVTGGYVYRGAQFPDLTGSYIYGDYETGEIWSVFSPYTSPDNQLLIDTGISVSSFAEGDGEIYLLDIQTGEIHQFIPGAGTPTTPPFPSSLSATGCADVSNPKLGAQGMIEYDINSPLWSDAADKKRWFALPDDKTISINQDSNWEFPKGSVLRKDFYLNDKIIETRLLARHVDGGWSGYSYEWNNEETDAILLSGGKQKEIGGQTWAYPGQNDCLFCHTIGALRVIGPETAQMNRKFNYPDIGSLNQLTALNTMGYFSTSLSDNPASLDQLVSPTDLTKTLDQRARSYLHANCANCHRPKGTGRGPADFRYSTSLIGMKVCNADPSLENLGVPDAKLLYPGNPAKSIMTLRMKATNEFRMPSIGSSVVDNFGVALIEEWISSLSQCN